MWSAIGAFILFLMGWGVVRKLLGWLEARRLPEAPPGAPPPETIPAIEPALARRFKGAFTGLDEAIPVFGIQAGPDLGPPPPAARLEPADDHHVVHVDAPELPLAEGPPVEVHAYRG